MAECVDLPGDRRRADVQHKSSVLDKSTSSGVSETVWLQPQQSSASASATASSRLAACEPGRRPQTLPVQQQQQQQLNPEPSSRAPEIADRLAETAKSADLKALIRYVGHQKAFQDPYGRCGIVESAGALMDGHVIALQSCIRHATRRLTHFINSASEVVSIVDCSSYDVSEICRVPASETDERDISHQSTNATAAAADLSMQCRRLHKQCRLVSDDVLPSLVEALRASMSPLIFADDRLADAVKWDLVDATMDALQPCTQLVLIARQLLDDITDVDVVSDMTTRVLSVAEALQRMRTAAIQSASELTIPPTSCGYATDAIFPRKPRDVEGQQPEAKLFSSSAAIDHGDDIISAATASDTALDVYYGYSSNVRLPLASMEICDAAYRQIQRAGASIGYCYWPPIESNEHMAGLLTTIVANCCDIGSSMEVLSRSAERGQMQLFHQAVRTFADATCRVLVTIAQIGLTERKLLLTSKAIRHCASSLITSARLIVADRQHPVSYRIFAAHSHALSRALAELVNHLSSLYVEN